MGRIINDLRKELRALADPCQASILSGFFKTGPGQYGAGDLFLGIRVPVLRMLSQRYRACPLRDLAALLRSKIHEERMVALMILIDRYRRGTDHERESIISLYLGNIRHVNNWDLVDISADKILGRHLAERDRGILYRLARSSSLWERRIAIMATFHFIKMGDITDTLAIAEILLRDGHDLIHKATGWMLREVGKRDLKAELRFLDRHDSVMPRTMLRYAIEKFNGRLKKKYMRRGSGIRRCPAR
jgi:3-methyladenine DNA glycosylase AlkD